MQRNIFLLLITTFTFIFYNSNVFSNNLNNNDKISKIINESSVLIPSVKSTQGISSDYKCILFDNLDPYHFSAYYQYIQSSEYSERFTRASFTDDFFKKNYITDFDLIIIPLGNYLLNAKTPGGIKIIDKILEAYNAGKSIMITGNLALVGAFRTQIGDDPSVKNFFTNILGIDYIGYRPTCDSTISGSTINIKFNQFIARGAIKDPVSWAAIKYCNVIFDGQTPLNPYCYNVDVFKLKNNSQFKPVDHFVLDDKQPLTDTLLGIRSDKKDGGKLVFWSMGFEYMSTNYSRQFAVTSAINWLLTKAPAPGPKLEFIPNEINFGALEIGKTASAEFIALNSGESVLTVENVEFSFGSPAFQLEGGLPKTPFNLQANETKSFKVIFKPTEDYNYIDYLDFTSNDAESQIKGIALKGRGGKGIGPLLELNHNQLNFGSVGVLKQKFIDLIMSNGGNRELTINWISIENNEKKAYSFVFGSAVPVILQPGQSKTVRIKFVPQEVGEVYNSMLKILSTSLDATEKYIPIYGIGIEPGMGPKIETSVNEIDFGYAEPNNPPDGKTELLTIYNLGEYDLEIIEISFENNIDNVYNLLGEHIFPIRLEMGNSYDLEINFKPKEEKHYKSQLVIYSNAENEPEKKIALKGSGSLSSIKEFYNTGNSNVKMYYSNSNQSLVFEYYSSNPGQSFLNLSLYESTGKFIKSIAENYELCRSNRHEFNLIGLSNGVYLVKGSIGKDIITYIFIHYK